MTGFARLDAAAKSIGLANKKMGERYAHRTDGQRTQLQARMVQTEGSTLTPGSRSIWKE